MWFVVCASVLWCRRLGPVASIVAVAARGLFVPFCERRRTTPQATHKHTQHSTTQQSTAQHTKTHTHHTRTTHRTLALRGAGRAAPLPRARSSLPPPRQQSAQHRRTRRAQWWIMPPLCCSRLCSLVRRRPLPALARSAAPRAHSSRSTHHTRSAHEGNSTHRSQRHTHKHTHKGAQRHTSHSAPRAAVRVMARRVARCCLNDRCASVWIPRWRRCSQQRAWLCAVLCCAVADAEPSVLRFSGRSAAVSPLPCVRVALQPASHSAAAAVRDERSRCCRRHARRRLVSGRQAQTRGGRTKRNSQEREKNDRQPHRWRRRG